MDTPESCNSDSCMMHIRSKRAYDVRVWSALDIVQRPRPPILTQIPDRCADKCDIDVRARGRCAISHLPCGGGRIMWLHVAVPF